MRTQVLHDPAVATPWLEGNLDGHAEKTFLETFPFKIGRNEAADLCIDSTRVSREHALITRHGKKYHLHDLGSTNGTFLNGQRIQDESLSDGDQVMIAELEFTFYTGAPAVDRDTATQVMPHAEPSASEDFWNAILAVRRVHEAVTRRGLRFVFQPIVELETGEPFGYEALIADSGADRRHNLAAIIGATASSAEPPTACGNCSAGWLRKKRCNCRPDASSWRCPPRSARDCASSITCDSCMRPPTTNGNCW